MACALPWATLPASTLLKTNSLSRALHEKEEAFGLPLFHAKLVPSYVNLRARFYLKPWQQYVPRLKEPLRS